MQKTSRIVAVLGTVALMSTLLLRAADPTESPAGPSRPKQMPFRGKIEKVDAKARTVALFGREKSRVFHVTDESKIRRDGKAVKLDELKAGESVGGLARANGENRWDIVTLNIGDKNAKDTSATADETPTTQ